MVVLQSPPKFRKYLYTAEREPRLEPTSILIRRQVL